MKASEDQECMSLVAWWRYHCKKYQCLPSDLVHMPNEGKRTPKYGNKMKKMGLRKGYPDYLLDVPVGRYHGLRFEAKSKGKKPTEEQRVFLLRLSRRGYYCFWTDDIGEAIDRIAKYLDGDL